MKSRCVLKITALFTAFIFAFTTVTFSDPLSSEPAVKDENVRRYPLSWTISVPESAGAVSARYTCDKNGDLTFVLISDAHCNYEVQKNIKNIIENLRLSGKRPVLFLEGAFSELNFEHFDNSGYSEPVKDASLSYLTSIGEISGAEWAGIISSGAVPAIGCEDKKLYDKNRKAFLEILSYKSPLSEEIESIEDILSQLRSLFYGDKLREFEDYYFKYYGNEITFFEYVKIILKYADEFGVDIFDYPNIKLFDEVLDRRNRIDFEKLQFEIGAYLNLLLDRIDESGLKEKVRDFTENYFSGKITKYDYFKYIVDLGFKLNINIVQFADLYEYSKYLDVYRRIDKRELKRERKLIERELKVKIIKKENKSVDFENSLELLDLSENLRFIENLINLKLFNYDFDEFSEKKDKFNAKRYVDFILKNRAYLRELPKISLNFAYLDRAIREVYRFYSSSLKRDVAMSKKAVALSAGLGKDILPVMVVGGFHIKGISEQLQEKGYSYVVVRPAISSEGNSAEIYLRRMAEDTAGFRTPLLSLINAVYLALQSRFASNEGYKLICEEFDIVADIVNAIAEKNLSVIEKKLGIKFSEELKKFVADIVPEEYGKAVDKIINEVLFKVDTGNEPVFFNVNNVPYHKYFPSRYRQYLKNFSSWSKNWIADEINKMIDMGKKLKDGEWKIGNMRANIFDRRVVDIITPYGSFLMYKSTGKGTGAESRGEWVPIPGFAGRWFIKDWYDIDGEKNPKFHKYGVKAFKDIANYLKDHESELFLDDKSSGYNEDSVDSYDAEDIDAVNEIYKILKHVGVTEKILGFNSENTDDMIKFIEKEFGIKVKTDNSTPDVALVVKTAGGEFVVKVNKERLDKKLSGSNRGERILLLRKIIAHEISEVYGMKYVMGKNKNNMISSGEKSNIHTASIFVEDDLEFHAKAEEMPKEIDLKNSGEEYGSAGIKEDIKKVRESGENPLPQSMSSGDVDTVKKRKKAKLYVPSNLKLKSGFNEDVYDVSGGYKTVNSELENNKNLKGIVNRVKSDFRGDTVSDAKKYFEKEFDVEIIVDNESDDVASGAVENGKKIIYLNEESLKELLKGCKNSYERNLALKLIFTHEIVETEVLGRGVDDAALSHTISIILEQEFVNFSKASDLDFYGRFIDLSVARSKRIKRSSGKSESLIRSFKENIIKRIPFSKKRYVKKLNSLRKKVQGDLVGFKEKYDKYFGEGAFERLAEGIDLASPQGQDLLTAKIFIKINTIINDSEIEDTASLIDTLFGEGTFDSVFLSLLYGSNGLNVTDIYNDRFKPLFVRYVTDNIILAGFEPNLIKLGELYGKALSVKKAGEAAGIISGIIEIIDNYDNEKKEILAKETEKLKKCIYGKDSLVDEAFNKVVNGDYNGAVEILENLATEFSRKIEAKPTIIEIKNIMGNNVVGLLKDLYGISDMEGLLDKISGYLYRNKRENIIKALKEALKNNNYTVVSVLLDLLEGNLYVERGEFFNLSEFDKDSFYKLLKSVSEIKSDNRLDALSRERVNILHTEFSMLEQNIKTNEREKRLAGTKPKERRVIEKKKKYISGKVKEAIYEKNGSLERILSDVRLAPLLRKINKLREDISIKEEIFRNLSEKYEKAVSENRRMHEAAMAIKDDALREESMNALNRELEFIKESDGKKLEKEKSELAAMKEKEAALSAVIIAVKNNVGNLLKKKKLSKDDIKDAADRIKAIFSKFEQVSDDDLLKVMANIRRYKNVESAFEISDGDIYVSEFGRKVMESVIRPMVASLEEKIRNLKGKPLKGDLLYLAVALGEYMYVSYKGFAGMRRGQMLAILTLLEAKNGKEWSRMIAQLPTGQGKTAVTAIASFVKSLYGTGVFAISTTDALAYEGYLEAKSAFSVGGIGVGFAGTNMSREEKMEEYGGINDERAKRGKLPIYMTYTTMSTLAQDIATDNFGQMQKGRKRGQYRSNIFGLRDYRKSQAIIDEVDSVIVFQARTSFIQSDGKGVISDTEVLFAKAAYEMISWLNVVRREEEYVSKDEYKRIKKEKKPKGEEPEIVISKGHAVITEAGRSRLRELLRESGLDVLNDKMKNDLEIYEKDDKKANDKLMEVWDEFFNAAADAKFIQKENEGYIVIRDEFGAPKEIMLVDINTGKNQYNMRQQNRRHQLLEAKHNVPIKGDSGTKQSIAVSDVVNRYLGGVCGLTGTAESVKDIFKSLYDMDVRVIASDTVNKRVDMPQEIYESDEFLYLNMINGMIGNIIRGIPTLVVSPHVKDNQILKRKLAERLLDVKVRRLLKEYGIEVRIYNEKDGEAVELNSENLDELFNEDTVIEIIKEEETLRVNTFDGETSTEVERRIIESDAGKGGAITLATNVGGRGSDFKLFSKIEKRVGLRVFLNGISENRGIDLQALGRTARLLAPGYTRQFISLERDRAFLFNAFATPINEPFYKLSLLKVRFISLFWKIFGLWIIETGSNMPGFMRRIFSMDEFERLAFSSAQYVYTVKMGISLYENLKRDRVKNKSQEKIRKMKDKILSAYSISDPYKLELDALSQSVVNEMYEKLRNIKKEKGLEFGIQDRESVLGEYKNVVGNLVREGKLTHVEAESLKNILNLVANGDLVTEAERRSESVKIILGYFKEAPLKNYVEKVLTASDEKNFNIAVEKLSGQILEIFGIYMDEVELSGLLKNENDIENALTVLANEMAALFDSYQVEKMLENGTEKFFKYLSKAEGKPYKEFKEEAEAAVKEFRREIKIIFDMKRNAEGLRGFVEGEIKRAASGRMQHINELKERYEKGEYKREREREKSRKPLKRRRKLSLKDIIFNRDRLVMATHVINGGISETAVSMNGNVNSSEIRRKIKEAKEEIEQLRSEIGINKEDNIEREVVNHENGEVALDEYDGRKLKVYFSAGVGDDEVEEIFIDMNGEDYSELVNLYKNDSDVADIILINIVKNIKNGNKNYVNISVSNSGYIFYGVTENGKAVIKNIGNDISKRYYELVTAISSSGGEDVNNMMKLYKSGIFGMPVRVLGNGAIIVGKDNQYEEKNLRCGALLLNGRLGEGVIVEAGAVVERSKIKKGRLNKAVYVKDSYIGELYADIGAEITYSDMKLLRAGKWSKVRDLRVEAGDISGGSDVKDREIAEMDVNKGKYKLLRRSYDESFYVVVPSKVKLLVLRIRNFLLKRRLRKDREKLSADRKNILFKAVIPIKYTNSRIENEIKKSVESGNYKDFKEIIDGKLLYVFRHFIDKNKGKVKKIIKKRKLEPFLRLAFKEAVFEFANAKRNLDKKDYALMCLKKSENILRNLIIVDYTKGECSVDAFALLAEIYVVKSAFLLGGKDELKESMAFIRYIENFKDNSKTAYLAVEKVKTYNKLVEKAGSGYIELRPEYKIGLIKLIDELSEKRLPVKYNPAKKIISEVVRGVNLGFFISSFLMLSASSIFYLMGVPMGFYLLGGFVVNMLGMTNFWLSNMVSGIVNFFTFFKPLNEYMPKPGKEASAESGIGKFMNKFAFSGDNAKVIREFFDTIKLRFFKRSRKEHLTDKLLSFAEKSGDGEYSYIAYKLALDIRDNKLNYKKYVEISEILELLDKLDNAGSDDENERKTMLVKLIRRLGRLNRELGEVVGVKMKLEKAKTVADLEDKAIRSRVFTEAEFKKYFAGVAGGRWKELYKEYNALEDSKLKRSITIANLKYMSENNISFFVLSGILSELGIKDVDEINVENILKIAKLKKDGAELKLREFYALLFGLGFTNIEKISKLLKFFGYEYEEECAKHVIHFYNCPYVAFGDSALNLELQKVLLWNENYMKSFFKKNADSGILKIAGTLNFEDAEIISTFLMEKGIFITAIDIVVAEFFKAKYGEKKNSDAYKMFKEIMQSEKTRQDFIKLLMQAILLNDPGIYVSSEQLNNAVDKILANKNNEAAILQRGDILDSVTRIIDMVENRIYEKGKRKDKEPLFSEKDILDGDDYYGGLISESDRIFADEGMGYESMSAMLYSVMSLQDPLLVDGLYEDLFSKGYENLSEVKAALADFAGRKVEKLMKRYENKAKKAAIALYIDLGIFDSVYKADRKLAVEMARELVNINEKFNSGFGKVNIRLVGIYYPDTPDEIKTVIGGVNVATLVNEEIRGESFFVFSSGERKKYIGSFIEDAVKGIVVRSDNFVPKSNGKIVKFLTPTALYGRILNYLLDYNTDKKVQDINPFDIYHFDAPLFVKSNNFIEEEIKSKRFKIAA